MGNIYVLENDEKKSQEEIYLPEQLIKDYKDLTDKVQATLIKIRKRKIKIQQG